MHICLQMFEKNVNHACQGMEGLQNGAGMGGKAMTFCCHGKQNIKAKFRLLEFYASWDIRNYLSQFPAFMAKDNG